MRQLHVSSSWTPVCHRGQSRRADANGVLSLDYRQAGRGQAGSDRGYETLDADATFETKSGHEVRAWKLSQDHENEAQLCIWSQARQEKDEAILAKKRERFEADLADLHKI